MDTMTYRNMDLLCTTFLGIVILLGVVKGQSCGPRVSARLLAEIPCDMSQSSYCSAPGSAYPWTSVKRYINDNQGLVRRMYGDEKHSSVLLNEIDGFQQKFDMLRNTFDDFRSRTVYGRSARGHRPSRRQPRPQLFEDDIEPTDSSSSTTGEPATIFRVVTETSIKVGEAITQSMRSTTAQETTVSYEPASEFDSETNATTSTPTDTTTGKTDDTTVATSETLTQKTLPTTESYVTTVETTTAATSTSEKEQDGTTERFEEMPVAMERVGYEDFEDEYEYEPRRKMDSSVLQNSVEEKLSYKEEGGPDFKRADPTKSDSNRRPINDDLKTESSVEETREENETKAMEEDEEVPRRGINACPVKNEVIAPYWANNTRGETLALLNVHPFEQYVHFEKCAFENHQMLCREGCRCEQQYRLHRLLAFDPKNECRGIFSDWFRFPSCCVCICYDLTPDIPRTRSRKGRM